MKRSDINIRDPYVLVYEGKYYLYGTRGNECWGKGYGLDCYVSTDLENFSDPVEVFTKPDDFWADMNFWAPEVKEYNGAFYMFASFKAEGVCRGTQVLKADSPLGPFKLHSDGPLTPRDWECLDGTLYVDENDDNTPYMVFSHEWVQVRDGEILAVKLTKDLMHTVGEPVLLFRASEAPWVRPGGENNDIYVTDGPFLFKSKTGKLNMLWSSFGVEGYTLALAESESGKVCGPWKQNPDLIFSKDGGHGMLFTSLDGRLMGALHSPNKTLQERPYFFEVKLDR